MKKLRSLAVLTLAAMSFAGCGSQKNVSDAVPSGGDRAEASAAVKEDIKYPEKNIEWVIPYGAGGISDLAVRIMATAVGGRIGGTIIPTNMAGAGGITAADYVTNQKPDGYTLYMGNLAQNGLQPAMDSAIEFAYDDFTFIGMYLTQEPVLVVAKDSPWQTFEDFAEAAKASPGKITYSTSGVGTSLHVGTVMVEEAAGISLQHVPFKSGTESIAAILGGHVDCGMHLMGDAKAMLDSGQFRALATTSSNPIVGYEDIPTMQSLGYDVSLVSWHGLVGPKGMDEKVVAKLEAALKASLEDETVKKQLTDLGVTPQFMSAEELDAYVHGNYSDIEAIVEKASLRK